MPKVLKKWIICGPGRGRIIYLKGVFYKYVMPPASKKENYVLILQDIKAKEFTSILAEANEVPAIFTSIGKKLKL